MGLSPHQSGKMLEQLADAAAGHQVRLALS
jgi:hypothetical protein